MKLKFKKIALLGSIFISLTSINALAERHLPSLDRLLGDDFIDIADDAVRHVHGPVIDNTVVNIGEVDASVTIRGERVYYEADTASSEIYSAGRGPLGNRLGENVSWGNSIETMANGSYASVMVIGRDGRYSDNDFFERGAILNTSYNTADINAQVNIRGYEKVDISNLHISTQAIGAYGSVTLANGYQHH